MSIRTRPWSFVGTFPLVLLLVLLLLVLLWPDSAQGFVTMPLGNRPKKQQQLQQQQQPIGVGESLLVRTSMAATHVPDPVPVPSPYQGEVLPDTSQPIPSNTFGGMVERRLIERFGEKNIQRILTSWRLLDQGYYRKVYVGEENKLDDENDDDDDIDTSMMIQECHSYVPGLSIRPFWNAQDFDWARYLESKYTAIRKEFDIVTSNLDSLRKEGNNIWAGALTDDAASYGEGWKTLVLMDRGRWDVTNVNLFPKTARAIYESGIPATEVFFASMAGPSHIQKHSDFTNFVLTSHLALDIPYSGTNQCRLTVGDTEQQWINGHIYVFDTSLHHEAINESDQVRYILMVRLWHPDLTPIEQSALQFTFDCLEFPSLVSLDRGERFLAETTAESVRRFPLNDDVDGINVISGGKIPATTMEKDPGGGFSGTKTKRQKVTQPNRSGTKKGFGR